jgi:molecular chaperone HtpG
MEDTAKTTPQEEAQPIAFKAETRQLLDILIHSLYTEREIFLRELISNASDALTRIDFEMLTNREVLDPDAELAIRITANKDEKTLTIADSGIGMTSEELVENLGTIAHSGARDFVQAVAEKGAQQATSMIGQFGVGFYSAFMVAEWIKVVSRSYQREAQATAWFSSGNDTFTVEPAEKEERGTQVIVKLREEDAEFLEDFRLREVIRKHSDFIPFPIYLGEDKEQANRQTALWRQSPREVEKKDYEEFYKQLTLDFEAPLTYTHMVVDAPAQMYALLYVPGDPERGVFSLRKDNGLKLYARKVLIQEYNKDLLPEYFAFIQGVVDSEDLPLNVSRESIQSNRVMAQLKKLVTSKVIDMLKKLAKEDSETYEKFWKAYDRFLKQGVAVEQNEPEALYPLLRFHTTAQPETWSSLDDYVERMKEGQDKIFYILGDDERSVIHSPHLDLVRRYDYETLLLTDPLDAFVLVRLKEYGDHALENVATADLKPPEGEEEKEEAKEAIPESESAALVERFKQQLGERVTDVRMTDRLSGSPARLVDPEGSLDQEMQRVYRLLNRDYEVPKKVLELNPSHPILVRLSQLAANDARNAMIIEQIYEDALLIEGLHPDPASMIERIQDLMEKALGTKE